MPNREARTLLVLLPSGERVPPLIFRLTTVGRRLRSAAWLSALARGSATKVNSSGKKRSTRWHSTLMGASLPRRWTIAAAGTAVAALPAGPAAPFPAAPGRDRDRLGPGHTPPAPVGPIGPDPGVEGISPSVGGCPAAGGSNISDAALDAGCKRRRSR